MQNEVFLKCQLDIEKTLKGCGGCFKLVTLATWGEDVFTQRAPTLGVLQW